MAPIAGLGFVAWQVWGDWLHRGDLVVFAILYMTTGLGITVGFHRHLTHRAFATTRPVRAVLAVLGSAAIEGPVISWAADHRKHHAFADVEGDPHSPHVGQACGWRGATAGLLHAHVGWLFVHTQRGARHRYAPDLLADPIIRLIDRTFAVWALGGLGAAFGLGCAIGGTARRAFVGCCGEALCGCSCFTTSPTASTRCAISSAAAGSPRPTARATSSCSRCHRSGSPGQQPPRLPDVGCARPALVGARRLVVGDPCARARRACAGRCRGQPRAPGAQGARAPGA